MAAAARSFVLTRTWDQIFDGLYRVYETAMRPAGEPAADLVEPSMEGVDA